MAKKLTKSYVDSLPFATDGRQVFYRDPELKGFGLRVGAKVKTYFAESKIGRKTVRVTLGKHDVLTTEEARKLAKGKLAAMAHDINPNAVEREGRAKAITLQEVYDEYIGTRRLKPKTLRDYGACVRRLFHDWRHKPMLNITRDMVEAKHKALSKRGEAQANLAMRLLRALFNYAQEYRDGKGNSLFPDNPVRRLTAKRIWNRIERRQTYINPNQLKPWFEAVLSLHSGHSYHKPDVVRDYLLFILLTGCRREEAAALRWSEVDLTGRAVTFLDTKNGTDFRLPLPNYLTELLAERKQAAQSAFVFAGDGGTGHLVEPRRQTEKVIAMSGIEFTLHDLRRTFATIAESLDLSAYALKRLLNHKSGANGDVTAGYIVPDVERLRDPIQAIADYILKAAGQKPTAKVVPIKREVTV